MKLCTCNNCGNIWEDMNPQTDSKNYPDTPDFKPLKWIREDGTNDWFWGCPKCETDGFLSDDVNDKPWEKLDYDRNPHLESEGRTFRAMEGGTDGG